MSDEIVVLLMVLSLLAGGLIGAVLLLSFLTREVTRGASAALELARGPIDAAAGLHSAGIDPREAEIERNFRLDGGYGAPGSPRSDASPLAEGSPLAAAKISPEASRRPRKAIFGPYPGRSSSGCRFCDRVRRALGF